MQIKKSIVEMLGAYFVEHKLTDESINSYVDNLSKIHK